MSAVDAPGPQARRRAALGLLFQMERGTFRVNGREHCMFARAGMTRAEFDATLPQYLGGRWFAGFPEQSRDGLFMDYVAPMIELAAEAGHDAPFMVAVGDNRRSLPAPAFVRARRVGHPGLGVIQRFRSHNHTPDTFKITGADIPFEKKADQLVWRGATTGRFKQRAGENGFSSRYFVMAAQRAIDDPRIDIGYSSLAQMHVVPPHLKAQVSAAIRAKLSWDEMLNARFLLVLEGNDVATALPWVLHANSCPIMPTPLFESWFCESALRRNVHYAPVSPDLSDLQPVFDACVCERRASARIAANGRQFIQAFLDDDAEHALALEVAKTVFHKVKLVPGSKGELPDGLF
ncbi:MAG: glycosyl transferase family 90 [Pseudomonadota bacterium]